MSRQSRPGRSLAPLAIAGILPVGLLSALTIPAVASTSSPSGASEVTAFRGSGLMDPIMASKGVAFGVNGVHAEDLTNGGITITDEQVTFARGDVRSPLVDKWLAAQGDPKEPVQGYVTMIPRDYADNALAHYKFTYPQVTRIDTGIGGGQVITFKYRDVQVTRG